MRKVKPECMKQFHKGNRFNFTMTLFSLLLASLMNIGMAFMLQYFIEAVEFSDNIILNKGFIITAAYMIIYGSFSFLIKKYRNRYMRSALSQFKNYVFEKILHKSIAQYENGASAKFISAFSNDLNSIETNYLGGTLSLILTILMYVGAVIASIYIKWKLAIPIFIVSLICIMLSLKYGQKLVKKESETSDENMGFVAQVKDLLSGFIVIKSFKAENEVLKIFKKKNVELEEAKQGRRETSDTVSIYGDISSIIVNILIFGLGFYYAFAGEMSIGMVIAFIQLGNYILGPVRSLAPLISNRRAAIELIYRISDAIEEEDERPEGIPLLSFNDKIEFRNVNFSYEEEKEVLNNINVSFEKGKSYAIVGASGCGKSTILKLMLGYHLNYQGDILIDGTPIKNINLDSLYDKMSIIQQEVFLFDSSIKDNITMFSEFNEDIIRKAIEKAGLSDYIKEKGDDYSCGEGGKNLSGGEKQRVSIARCLIRETPILLMDEATAALDNKTAHNVENAILDIENITRIIVTHRYNEDIMRKYDSIIVMNKGHIIEHGHFDELMQAKGFFYSLFNISKED